VKSKNGVIFFAVNGLARSVQEQNAIRMDIFHSPQSGTPGAPLRLKSSTPRSGFVQQS
jgi:hypothetical protein